MTDSLLRSVCAFVAADVAAGFPYFAFSPYITTIVAFTILRIEL
jgi:hypothetical protein